MTTGSLCCGMETRLLPARWQFANALATLRITSPFYWMLDSCTTAPGGFLRTQWVNMQGYCAYGLNISSEIPLPELMPSTEHPDVQIRYNDDLELPTDTPADQVYTICSPQVAYLHWQAVGIIRVCEGRSIEVNPAPEAEPIVLRYSIIGAALNHLLHQRRLLLVHASVVAIDDQAVAFVGESGWGKSTLAAYMQTRGHSLVSDDALVVDMETSKIPIVLPGFPQRKLWPDVLVSLGAAPEPLPRLDSTHDKRVQAAHDDFYDAPLPLGRIYILDHGIHRQSEIETLAYQDAFKTLMLFTYGRSEAPNSPTKFLHLQQCAAIAGCVPISRLRRRFHFDELSDLAAMIEADCGNPQDCL